MSSSPSAVAQAYQACQQLAKTHYENFPVATRLLPKRMRAPMTVIYTFARTADDIVDEGEQSAAERMSALNQLQHRITQLPDFEANDDLMIALNDTLKQYDLPIDAFLNLLTAFRMDLTQTTYADHQSVLEYCRFSANPVGRLVLALFGYNSSKQYEYSDHICTTLQLINFLQDIVPDYQLRKRIYLPLDELKAYDLTPETLFDSKNQTQIARLMAHELNRCQAYLDQGRPLIATLSGRLKLYIALIVCSAQCIIDKLRQRAGAIQQRPVITKLDKIKILAQGLALSYRSPKALRTN